MTYKEQFIKFMSDSGVLTFGSFTLKSGRQAPYFINAGKYMTGEQLTRLGEFYADCIHENGLEADILFGPAYKGIPLSVSAAVSMYSKYKRNFYYSFDRKEAKDHGEGGIFVGRQPVDGDRVIIIEDVMTSGKALREVYPKLTESAKIEIAGMVITVDRMETGLNSSLSAVQEVYRDFGVKVYSIVNILDIIAALEKGIIDGKEHIPAMREYLERYGAKPNA